jgi:hypothetical protein
MTVSLVALLVLIVAFGVSVSFAGASSRTWARLPIRSACAPWFETRPAASPSAERKGLRAGVMAVVLGLVPASVLALAQPELQW